jgi:hypothetical protein
MVDLTQFGALLGPEPEPDISNEQLRRQQMMGGLGMLSGVQGVGRLGRTMYADAARQLQERQDPDRPLANALKQVQLARGLKELGTASSDWTIKADPVGGGFIRFNKRTGAVEPVEGYAPGYGARAAAGAEGYGAVPKMNESQAKAFRFGKMAIPGLQRMMTGLEGLEQSGLSGLAGRQFVETRGGGVMGGLSAAMTDPALRAYLTNAMDAVANIVYSKSGAQVTDSEWKTAITTYIPMPWDTDAEKQDKVRRVQQAALTTAQSAGPGGQILVAEMLEAFGAPEFPQQPGGGAPAAPVPGGLPNAAGRTGLPQGWTVEQE